MHLGDSQAHPPPRTNATIVFEHLITKHLKEYCWQVLSHIENTERRIFRRESIIRVFSKVDRRSIGWVYAKPGACQNRGSNQRPFRKVSAGEISSANRGQLCPRSRLHVSPS